MAKDNEDTGAGLGEGSGSGSSSDTAQQARRNWFHPALPSTEAAHANHGLLTSDHVPILATVPVAGAPDIRIVSWNVLEWDRGNGFAPAGVDRIQYGETKEQTTMRHDRIAQSVATIANSNQPHFITLQEITAGAPYPEAIYKKIRTLLPSKWVCVEFDGGVTQKDSVQKDSVTFYDSEQFTLTNSAVPHDELGGIAAPFIAKNAPHSLVNILNAHAPFRRRPDYHERHINDFLQTNKTQINVVIGDLNCPVQGITTSVSPPCWSNGIKIQDGHAIDAAFYSTPEGVCKQATIQHLDPGTGRAYSPEQLTVNEALLDEEHQEKTNYYRAVICVDESYKHELLIRGLTIFQYQQELEQQYFVAPSSSLFEHPDILVRAAKNLKDENAIGIFIDSKTYNFLQLIKPLSFQFNFYDGEGDNPAPLYAVFADRARVAELDEAIQSYLKHLKHLKQPTLLGKLVDNITQLATFERIKKDAKTEKAIGSLKTLVATLYADAENPGFVPNESRTAVLRNFVSLTEKWLKESKMPTADDIQKFAKKLTADLYGKPPLSAAIKAAIWGVLSAIAGFVIGAFAGALITGGPGAIPGAILGVTVALGAAGSGVAAGAAGATAGFFPGRSKKRAYDTQRKAKQIALGDIRKSVNQFTSLWNQPETDTQKKPEPPTETTPLIPTGPVNSN